MVRLMKRCSSAAKYKGIRKPTCNGDNPCEACVRKYARMQRGCCPPNEQCEDGQCQS